MPIISSQTNTLKFKIHLILSLLILITFKAQSETLTPSLILQKIEESYGYNKEFKLIEKQASFNENNTTALYNPEINVGFGRIDNSSFKGPYQQWSISQTFEINGQKNLAQQQIKTLAVIDQNKNRITQRDYQTYVLQIIFQLKAEQEHLYHLNERIQELNSLKVYLKNKSFISPKDQMSRSMIENLFDEIQLKKINLLGTIQVLKNNLKFILDLKDEPEIKMPWLDLNKLKVQLIDHNISTEATHLLAQSKLKLIDQKKRSINKEWIPDVNLTYSESRENIPGGNRNDTLSIGLSIPIFNFNQNSRSALNAEKEIETLNELRNSKDFKMKYNERVIQLSTSLNSINELNPTFLNKKDKMEKKFLKHFKQGQIEVISYLEIEKQTHSYHEYAMDANLKGHLQLFEILKLTPITYSLEKILNENVL